MAADISKIVALIIQAKDQASAVLKGAEKSIESYDDTLGESAKNSESAGKSAKKGAKGFTELGDSAEASAKKVTTANSSAKKSISDIAKAWELLGSKSTKAYKRELELLNAAFERVKNSGKSSAEDIARAQSALIKKQKELAASIDGKKVAKEFETIQDAVGSLLGSITSLLASAGIVITPIVETAKFNRSMAEVQAVLGDVTDNEFQELTDKAREMGATTEFSAQQAAEGLKFLAQAGFDATESMEALPGVLNLAQAGNVGLGEAADIASNILTGMGLEVSELDRVNDVLVEGFTSTNTSLAELGSAFSFVAPIAASFGVSVEETTAAIGLLSNAGIKASTAGTTLRSMFTSLAKPSAEGAEAMRVIAQRIGQTSLQITDANGKFLSLSSIIGQFEKAGLTATEAITILGREAGPGLVALVSQGAGAFDELNDSLLTSAGRADEVAKIMRDNLVGDFKSAQSAVSELALSIGDQLIPVARIIVQVFADLVGVVSSLINDYPTLSKIIIGLVVAFAALASALSTLNMVKTLAPLLAVQWATMRASVIAYTSAIVSGFGKAVVAIKLMETSSVVLLALSAVVAGAILAYAIFAESAEDAAKKHLENASAIGEVRKELNDEIKDLEKIQEIFKDSDADSNEFVRAQEKLVELMPGVNSYVDEQGRLLALVGDDGEEAASGIQSYIDELKQDEQLKFVDQLEQTQKSLQVATEGAKDYAERLKGFYGRGSDDVITRGQAFNKSLGDSFGFYARNIKKHTELREAQKESGKEMNNLLRQAQQSGLSVEGLTEALAKNGVGTKESTEILKKYTDIITASEEAQLRAEQKAREMGATEKELAEVRKKSAKELKDDLRELTKESKEFGTEITSQNKVISTSLKALEKDYDELNGLAKRRADSELEAIESVKQARLRSVEGLNEGPRLKAETEIFLDAFKSRVSAIRDFTSESEDLFRQEESVRRELAEKGGQGIGDIELDLLNKRRDFYQKTVEDYRSMIDNLISEENRHLDAVRAIEEEKRNSRLSTEDKIRALQNKGLTEEEQHADKLKQVNEKQSDAKRALAEGDFELAQRLNDQARSLAEQSIRSASGIESESVTNAEKTVELEKEKLALVKERKTALKDIPSESIDRSTTDAADKEVASAEKRLKEAEASLKKAKEASDLSAEEAASASIEKTIEELKESETIGQEILDSMLAAHKEAAEAIAGERENLQVGLQEAEQKLVELNTQLLELATADIEIQAEQVDEAIAKVNELSEKLDEIDGRVARAKVIIEEQTIQSRAGGGPASPFDFKRLGSPLVNRGSGIRDDVPAMLMRGEYVVKRSAVAALIKKFGSGAMNAINAGRLPTVQHLATGGFALPAPARVSAPVVNNSYATPEINFPDLGTVVFGNEQEQTRVFVPQQNYESFMRIAKKQHATALRGSGRRVSGGMPWE